ncbi:MAG: hypothetical protein ACRYGK_05185 [Janthinobacterium lividum]
MKRLTDQRAAFPPDLQYLKPTNPRTREADLAVEYIPGLKSLTTPARVEQAFVDALARDHAFAETARARIELANTNHQAALEVLHTMPKLASLSNVQLVETPVEDATGIGTVPATDIRPIYTRGQTPC